MAVEGLLQDRLSGYTVVYGGSFDPPHLSHQMTCLYLLSGLAAEQVWVVPTDVHPFGKQSESFEHRAAMCRLMLEPFGDRAVVRDVERHLKEGGRTFYTLQHLEQQHPERRFALAVGADIMDSVTRWYRFDAILAMVPVVVVGRQGYPSYGSPIALPAVSSTHVRQAVQQGQSLVGFVPAAVEHYIHTHKLYLDGKHS